MNPFHSFHVYEMDSINNSPAVPKFIGTLGCLFLPE